MKAVLSRMSLKGAELVLLVAITAVKLAPGRVAGSATLGGARGS